MNSEEISSINNSCVKEFIKLLDNKNYRNEKSLVPIEGFRVLKDCLENNLNIRSVFIEKEKTNKFNDFIKFLPSDTKIYTISERISDKMSKTKNTQGLFAIIEKPNKSDFNTQIKNKCNFLIMISIKDPNNMGLIIRTAVAFGFKSIILDKFCVDVYNEKVIRGSMGNVFKINFYISENAKDDIIRLNDEDYMTVATVLNEDSVNLNTIDMKNRPVAVIMGNEADG
ncbi:MAG: TrmH family RNA methyltransferase, partial [Oscillospiraceae bacterium]